ncbi:hypothetical protein A11S_2338 [Micavibrio aeruginosavorus EPB]|uniref:Uncharacterized protein n=1 Tax=Micavibrio aeruginosavorus EPB TaxID=349215 RepID=M4VIU8_9BACT|nr:hypothetical protein A11S_2338 [Micavibrio aeruginosavorus EPB]
MRAARAAGNGCHGVQAEGQQHGLLHPLMHDPIARNGFGNAQVAVIQQLQRFNHGIAHITRRTGVQGVACVPSLFDKRFNLCMIRIVCHTAYQTFRTK